MAFNRWLGTAQKTTDVWTATISGYDAATQYRLTLNGKTISVTGQGGTVTTTAVALVAAWNASTEPEIAELTASNVAGAITLTTDTSGYPIGTVTSSVTGGTGTFGAASHSTTATGPNHFSNARNWSLGTAPVGEAIAPVQAAAVAAAGGSLTDTQTYYWVITATNANGESIKSNERSLVIAAPNQTATLSWAAVTNATGYKVYRSTSAGVYGATSLVTTIGSGATVTYNDTGAALSAGTPPATSTALGDDVVYDASSDVDCLYDLAQSYLALNSLRHDMTYNGRIGLPKWNAGGYYEYRQDYLQVAPATSLLGTGTGDGSGRIKIDRGSVPGNDTVYATGAREETDVEAVLLKGTSTANVFNILGGDVGIAVYGGETAACSQLNVNGRPTVRGGPGFTVTTLTLTGGTLSLSAAVTTWNQLGGTAIIDAGAVANLVLSGGILVYKSTGALGGGSAPKVAGSSLLDFTQDMRAKTLSNTISVIGPDAFVNDSNKVVTGFVVNLSYGASLAQVLGGENATFTRS